MTRIEKWKTKRESIPTEPKTVCEKLEYMFKKIEYKHHKEEL